MMPSCRKILAALVVVFSFGPTAHAQHVVGGGDPLMMMFAEARYDAIRMLDHITAVGIPIGIDLEVANFLRRPVMYDGQAMLQSAAMAADLLKATLLWQPTDLGLNKCAAIELNADDPPNIYLSLPTCRALLTLDVSAGAATGANAAWTLIHESSHRFGLGTSGHDEDLASRIGVVVFNVWEAARIASVASWSSAAAVLAPSRRAAASSVWTGSGDDSAVSNQVLIWGGCERQPIPGQQTCASFPSTGGRFLYTKSGSLGEAPTTSWLPMDATTAPLGRKFHSAVWTGAAQTTAVANKMLIFGGCRGNAMACDQSLAVTACDPVQGCDDARKNNSLYDPRADRWQAIADDGAPSPRVWHSAVWTQNDEMIVWGGLEGFQNPAPDRPLDDGAILAFSDAAPQGEWRPLTKTPNTPTPRFGHTAIWTGSEMIVWGGCGQSSTNVNRCATARGDGATFDPSVAGLGATDPWRALPPSPLAPRTRHSAIWTGRYLVIWGGEAGGTVLNDGAIFDAVARSWRLISSNLPPGEIGRRDHSAFFEPLRGRMIIWGGTHDSAWSTFPSDTLIYDLASDHWSRAATATDPVGRTDHVAAWIEDSLFVWGGYNAQSGVLAQGGLFNP